jgi:hypothetical protein
MFVCEVCLFIFRKSVDFAENAEFVVHITADIFTPLSQLGAKSFPSVIWLGGLEHEDYSSDTVLRF